MPSNTDKNQILKTSDLLIVSFAVSISVGLVTYIAADAARDDRKSVAVGETEVLARQLADRDFKIENLPVSLAPETAEKGDGAGARAPASVSGGAEGTEVSILAEGELAKDPWGVPYHYIITSPINGRRQIMVWTAGPNKSTELVRDQLLHVQKPGVVHLGKDDVAYVVWEKSSRP